MILKYRITLTMSALILKLNVIYGWFIFNISNFNMKLFLFLFGFIIYIAYWLINSQGGKGTVVVWFSLL